MSLKIVSPGGVVSEIITPLPVMIQGGEVAILEGAPVATVWSGPFGLRAPYPRAGYRQITPTNPTPTWVTGSPGATASDEAKVAGGWTEAQKALFLTEFPDARPGLLYGMVFISKGNNMAAIDDMYSSNKDSITVRRDRSASHYSSGYFSLGKLFEPESGSGGIWMITFPKPIPFHIGLRVSWDNGAGHYYFLHSLDPAFA